MTEELKESMVGKWIDNKRALGEKRPAHYYGDYVRRMFFVSGIVMLIGLPFFASNLELTVFAATLGVVIIGIFAGLTSPRQSPIIVFDVCVSAAASIIFELLTIEWYKETGGIDLYFFFNQILAILFFVALYFSVKTFRAMLSEKGTEPKV
jgi:hypothetical protein